MPVMPLRIEAEVHETRARATLRGEWLRLRVGLLGDRMKAEAPDPAPSLARLRELDEALGEPAGGGFALMTEVFGLDDAEAVLVESLASVELPGASCAALLEFGGRIAGGGQRVVVDALLAALSGGSHDAAAELLRRLGPGGRLRRFLLVEIDDADRPRRLAPVRLGAGLVEQLLGERPAGPGFEFVAADEAGSGRGTNGVDGVHGVHIEGEPLLVDKVAAALCDAASPVVLLVGTPGSGRSEAVLSAAARLGLPLLRADAEVLLSSSEAERESRIRRLGRDSALTGAVVLADGLVAGDPGNPAAASRRSGLRALCQLGAPLALTADGDEPAFAHVERPVMRLAAGMPDEAVRVSLWSAWLPAAEAEEVGRVFALGPRAIDHAGVAARVLASARAGRTDAVPGAAEAREAVRSLVAGGPAARELGGSEFRPSLDDLVLSADNRELLEELILRVRRRTQVLDEWGFRGVVGPQVGVSALFHGPPGTGKSMAAYAIATHLGVECLRVDLSQVVSKWVGETEKSLARVFEAAERSDSLLLFDEADSLFTRRTDVKSSNDRYANLEVNYLLQRVESFPGLAVLTTNHVGSIDTAFLRRLAIQVRFDPPDVAERLALWRRKLPPEAPIDPGVSLEQLAERYAMTGARIRNAALRAAFYAADAGTSITQAHLERAVLAEWRSAGIAPGAARHLE